ncbi:MAG: YecH family metal-binding protein [Rikenellaceae bacterium]
MMEVHAHEVLRMMEGNGYSAQSLRAAVVEKFGAGQLFYTCSAKGMDVDSLIAFLTAKGKFKPCEEGFTVDLNKVCSDY